MLENTLFRLKHDKKLTVGYFGGSITAGAGASNGEKTSWRGLSAAWLREKFPEAEIKTVNAAIGGTGSMLGIFRMENDLLSGKPDLVFVEFSVNDGLGSYDEILANSETIVRKIFASNPYADIIYVHTTTKGISDRVSAGSEYIARSAHSAVMHRYGVPQIDVGEILRTRVLLSGSDSEGSWKALTIDTVHPNDSGYRIYEDAIEEFLEKTLVGEPEKLTEKLLPERISPFDRIAARLVDPNESENDFTRLEKMPSGFFRSCIEALEPGKKLTFGFTGRRIGLYCMFSKDSGDVVYSIDGGEEKTVSTWDKYCKSFNRSCSVMLCDDLDFGEHTLKLRVSDKKNDESEGHAIRIGAFMVY